MNDNRISGAVSALGEHGIIGNKEVVFDTMTLDETITGSGGLTLGWNSITGNPIAPGPYGGYFLMNPYFPVLNEDGSYRYDVKLSEVAACLERKHFYINDEVSEIPLYSIPYTGPASVLISQLAAISGWGCSNHAGDAVISVSFDGDTIKSAADKIGQALGASVWYDSGGLTIHFGADNVDYMGGDYYDTFIVLGGTKNMSKRITNANGVLEYVAVTHRLTLGSFGEEGSKITTGSFGFEKFLIFDDIFPKIRMQINAVYRRQCWLHDDNGEKIQVGTSDGEPVYATYDKWYITLGNVADEGAIDQSTLDDSIIDGTTLMLQFLPRSEGGTSPLAGRIFELVHFTGDENIKEKEDDDVGDGFTVTTNMIAQGAYRIVMSAEGSTLLPSTLERGLVPQVGDIVSFVNVAPPESCYQVARQRLYDAAMQAIGGYSGTPTSSTSYGSGSIGSCGDGSIVTSVHTDLITGKSQVTRGTISQKGIISSLISKVESAQTIGGGGTTKDGQTGSTLMSEDQWEALRKAGGNLGMKSVTKNLTDVTNELENLVDDVNAIASQADQKMDIHFGQYTPLPNNSTVSSITMPLNAARRQDCKPAYDWATEAEKILHEEDLFYNYDGMASNPEGGTVWRWTRLARGRHIAEDGNAFTIATDIWLFCKVKDADTIAALEKIADVASDGKITGGSEKVRLYSDWTRMVDEHAKYNDLAENFGINVDAYNKAFSWMASMLNGGTAYPTGTDYSSVTPSWLLSSNLSMTTEILYTSEFIDSLNGAYSGWNISTSDLTQASRLAYRKIWNEYFAQASILDALCKSIANQAKEKADNLADDGVISAGSEKSQLKIQWQETVAEYWKLLEQAEDYELHHEDDVVDGNNVTRTPYNSYEDKFTAVALMLNNGNTQNVNGVMAGSILPSWIDNLNTDTILKPESSTDNTDTRIKPSEYRATWKEYYEARAVLMRSVEAAAMQATSTAQTVANNAMTKINDIADEDKIDSSEIDDARETFLTALHETYDAGGIMDKANDDSDNWIISWANILSVMQAQLVIIGRILNGETLTETAMWTLPITLATGHAANLKLFDSTKWSGNGIPTYLRNGYDQFPIELGAQASSYIDAWNEYYRLRTLALAALANKAQTTANQAKNTADNLASDSVISGGSEKNRLYLEWMAVVAEHSRYVTMAGAYSISTTDYDEKYNNLGKMLNGGSTLTEGDVPAWFSGNHIYENQTIIVSTYRNTWNAYYTARATLLQNIETASKALVDKAQTDAAAAMQSYEDIASDGTIDASAELPKLVNMFNTILSEMYGTGGYMIQAQGQAVSRQGIMRATWIIDENLAQDFDVAVKFLGNLLDNNQSPTWGNVYESAWAYDSTTNKFGRNLSNLRSPYYFDDSYAGGDISIVNDLNTTVATFKSKWKDVYDARSAMIAALADYARHLAEQSMIVAEAAIARLDDIADDEKITKEELPDIKKEFKLAVSEMYDSLYSKGRRNNNWISTAVGNWFENMEYAIKALGQYLDGTTDSERISSTWGDDTTNPNHASFVWPAVIDDSFVMSESIEIDREEFVDLWSAWYNARSTYLAQIANESLGKIEDMANDAKITPDEKKELRRQWTAWATEYDNFLALFNADPIINALSAVTAYKTAFASLGGFLTNPASPTFPDAGPYANTVPTMIASSDTTSLSAAQATSYKSLMTAFLAARTALLTALSTQKVSYYVSATKPAPPFYLGDRWLWLNHLANGEIADGTTSVNGTVHPKANTMMYCVKDNLATTNYDVSEYWVEASTILEVDPRSVLASLGDLLFREYGDNFPLAITIGDDGYGSVAYSIEDGSYNSLDVTDDMELLLGKLKEMLGYITIHAYTDDNYVSNLVKFDLFCSPVYATIPDSEDTIKGGVKVKMWNGRAWEYILESTNSLLDNLGTNILAMVFGSNDDATEASGLSVGQRFAKLFASATVWDATADDGNGAFVNLAEAILGLSVEPVKDEYGNVIYYDGSGNSSTTQYEGYYPRYISKGKLSADKIEFSATQSLSAVIGSTAKGLGMIAKQDGESNTFSMGFYYTDNEGTEHYSPVLYFDANGYLKINSSTATIDAELINIDVSELNISASDITFGESWFTSNIDGRITSALNSFTVNASQITFAAADAQRLSALGMLMKNNDGNGGLSFGYYTFNSTSNEYEWQSGISFVVENGVTKLNLTANNAKIAAELLDISARTIDLTAENFKISSTSDDTVAIFDGGKLKLDYIDVGALVAKALNTENIVVTGNGTIQNLNLVNLKVTGNSTFEGEVNGIVTAKQLYKVSKQIKPSIFDDSSNLRTRCANSNDGYGLIRYYSAEALIEDCGDLPSVLIIRDMEDAINEVPSAGITENSLMAGSFKMNVELPEASLYQGMEILVVLQGGIYYNSGGMKHFYRQFNLYSYNEEGFVTIMGGHNENSITFFYPNGGYVEKGSYSTIPMWSVRLISAYVETGYDQWEWKWMILETKGCDNGSWS